MMYIHITHCTVIISNCIHNKLVVCRTHEEMQQRNELASISVVRDKQYFSDNVTRYVDAQLNIKQSGQHLNNVKYCTMYNY